MPDQKLAFANSYGFDRPRGSSQLPAPAPSLSEIFLILAGELAGELNQACVIQWRRVLNGVSGLLENIRQTAFQTCHDLLEATKRNALLALLQTMKRRGGKPEFFGKLDKSHVAAFLAEKRSELFFQSVAHPAMLAKSLFRLRNKLLTAAQELGSFTL